MPKLYSTIEEEFSGNLDVLRIIFSTSNPIQTLHLLKTEIPYSTAIEYLEYLEVHEALKSHAHDEELKKLKDQQQNKGK